MRGLKQGIYADRSKDCEVASFTDAWIETIYNGIKRLSSYVASFTDAWIETTEGMSTEQILESHLLQMRGLKLKAQVSETWSRTSHLLQMRGLKLIFAVENSI